MPPVNFISDAIILERLSVYSKYSVNVFATTDKTKEALEGNLAISNDKKSLQSQR